MQPRTKTLFAILFVIPLVFAGLGAYGVYRIQRAGSLELSIQEKGGGCNVHVSLPAILVPIAVNFARTACPASDVLGFRDDRDIPVGAVRDVLDALADAPDGVFVEIQTGDEVVLVEKRAGRLLVDVDTRDEKVRAAVPLDAARSLFGVI
jgi:hypothetical protein